MPDSLIRFNLGMNNPLAHEMPPEGIVFLSATRCSTPSSDAQPHGTFKQCLNPLFALTTVKEPW